MWVCYLHYLHAEPVRFSRASFTPTITPPATRSASVISMESVESDRCAMQLSHF